MDNRKQNMLIALEQSLGIVTTACIASNVPRATHYYWLREDKDYKAAVEDIENIALDFAESQLHEQIRNSDTAATIFYLKCKGKKRGYIEQQNISARIEEVKAPSWFVSQDHIMITREAGKES